MRVPTSLLSAGSLVAGYATAAGTGVRPLGGAVLVVGAVLCARTWARETGAGTTAGLLALYAGAFVASHPLAKEIGAWPSVLSVAAVTGVAAHLLADRKALVAA